MTDVPQRVTLFERHSAPGVQRSWPSFRAFALALVESPPIVSDGDARPAWAPYTLGAAALGRRVTRHVGEYCQLVYDCDHATKSLADSLVAKLYANNTEALIYTTWSHPEAQRKGEYRLRAVLPLASPLGPIRMQANRRRGGAYYLSQEDDQSTKDLVRLFYGPCSKPGDPPPSWLYIPGEPLDINALPNIDFVNRESLLKWARTLAKRTSARDLMVGNALIRGIESGEPLAVDGQYNEFCFNLACLIARSPFPRADPKAIADLLGPAWSRTLPTEPLYLLHTLERVMRDRIVANEESPSHIRNFWSERGDPDRTDPYMPSELAKMRAPYSDQQPPWIIEATDRRVHFFAIGGYGRSTHPASAAVQALHDLAPAPVRLYDDDSAAIPFPALLSNPSLTRTNVRVNYALNRPAEEFDERASTLTICLCPPRDVGPPAPDPFFSTWLKVAFGPERDTVERWLAWLPDTTTALAGIYLHGQPGTGKNLFAFACSRLWTRHGPNDLHRILGMRFNSALAYCPLTWADEEFPKDDRGRPKTTAYRAFIGSAAQDLEFKNRDMSTLIGYPRAVFTANDEDMLRLFGDHSQDALQAIAERFVSVAMAPESVTFLKSVGSRWLAEHVASDAMTRHINWLALSRGEENTRFKVAAKSERGSQVMLLGSGIADGIFAAAIKYLTSAQQLPGWIVDNGRVCVRSRDLFDNWSSMTPQHAAPKSMISLGRALSSIASTRQHAPGSHEWYYPLDTEKLVFWAESAGVADRSVILARLKSPKLADVRNIRGPNP